MMRDYLRELEDRYNLEIDEKMRAAYYARVGCPELKYLRLTWAARAYKSTWRESDGSPPHIQEHIDNCDVCKKEVSNDE